MGGRVLVLEGVVMVLLGLLGVGPQALSAAIIGAIVVMLAITFIFSYRVWKLDPGKRRP